MIFNLAVVGAVILIFFLWVTRGFFNNLMHMLATVIAGAVAFGLWEPTAQLILGFTPESGFLTLFEGVAYGAGLLLPFAATLAALRAAGDQLVRNNVTTPDMADYIGGGLCAAVSSVVTVGIAVIAIGFFRVDSSFAGYNPIAYGQEGAARGSVIRGSGLWVPVDRIAAGLYGHASTTSLRTGTPLALYRPDIELAGYASRTSIGGGKGRNVVRPEDVDLISTYYVGPAEGAPASDLLTYTVQGSRQVQPYADVEGEPITAGRLFGAVVRFGAGAKESSGNVIVGAGQVSLLLHNEDRTEARSVHPVAVISQARAEDAELYARFRFDAEDVFIPSVGGAAESNMAFEFVVPRGFTPVAVTVKNARLPVSDAPGQPAVYQTAAARDAAVRTGAVVGAAGQIEEIDRSQTERLSANNTAEVSSTVGFGGTSATIALSNQLGFAFQTRVKRGLNINEDNQITDGEAKLAPEDTENQRGLDRSLLVDGFATTPDTTLVQVDVGQDSTASLLGRVGASVDRVVPPLLIDSAGIAYEAIGYIYRDGTIVEVRFTPGSTIGSLTELPSLSSARTDQSMRLLFRVSKGVAITDFALGNKAVVTIDPPAVAD